MTTPLFDPVAAWAALAPEHQAKVGAAAMAIAVAMVAQSDALDAESRAITAYNEALEQLEEAIDVAAPGLLEQAPPVDLRKLGVRMCVACGCTEACACPEGCSWATADLCSRCAPAEARS